MKPRIFLGRDQGLAGYRRVYEIEDGLEVDENSFVEIERTRVYFDDVLGMTYHVQMGVAFLVSMGLLALFFGGIAVIAGFNDSGMGVAVLFGCFAAPFLVAFILRLAMRVDVITVFGKRTMACMKFSFRKQRAREIYRDLTQKIRACQEKAAAALPKPAPPPAPEVPLPPAPPAPPAMPSL
jgi:hypothetical protein